MMLPGMSLMSLSSIPWTAGRETSKLPWRHLPYWGRITSVWFPLPKTSIIPVPKGMLFTQMLGAFAQYYSSALGTHVKKGLEQRALEGKHTGGIPFGYESCWINNDKGEKQLRCQPEHPGGIHVHPERRASGYRVICCLCSGQHHIEPVSLLG